MADCPESPVVIRLNSDLAKAVVSLRADLNRCNADKAGLRAWSADMTK